MRHFCKLVRSLPSSFPNSSLVTYWYGKLQLTKTSKQELARPLRYVAGAT
jgi:hypothetical protein